MIKKLEELPVIENEGILKKYKIPLKITVEEGSFLHIGAGYSPLTEKKAPVFSVDGIPVIPASSFKGAFRYQVEQLLIDKKNELKDKLNIANDEMIKPCVPAPRPSKAETELLTTGYRANCEIKIDEENVLVPKLNNTPIGLCPACYFFGATGIMGFLRIPNFWSETGEFRIDQTNIRIDRKTGTAAHGAIVSGEQVKPGTIFRGDLEIIVKQGNFEFGKPRTIGNTTLDLWLNGIQSNSLEQNHLLLINEILIPALNNLKILGGQKSKGAGKVKVEIDICRIKYDEQ